MLTKPAVIYLKLKVGCAGEGQQQFTIQRLEVHGQFHAPAALPTGKEEKILDPTKTRTPTPRSSCP
jgi:hypothetical protein